MTGSTTHRGLAVVRATVPTARAVRWSAPVLGAVAGVALVVLWQWRGAGPGSDGAVLALRAGALAVCGAAGAFLDDPAATTLEATPVGAPARRALRMAGAVVVVALAWLAELLVAAPGTGVLGLTLEVAGLAALALAAAAAAERWAGPGTATVASMPALLAVVATAWLVLPEGLTLFAMSPLDRRWAPSHERWLVVLVAAAVVTAAIASDRRLVPTFRRGAAQRGGRGRHRREG